MEIIWISEFTKLLVDVWFNTLFTAGILWLWFKYANKKLFSEENIQKARDVNEVIEDKENNRSKDRIRELQNYLDDNFGVFQKAWFDRVNVWHNHNWTRKGCFHFQYYSLISEVVSKWLELFSQHWINTQKLNFYMFSEYEKRAVWELPHLAQLDELGNTAKTIAEDLWTKSIYIQAIYNLKWTVDAIIFCSSVYNNVTKEPNLEKQIQDIRIIFNK